MHPPVMDASNNVFRGTSAVADFFDPDKNPPLPLVEIPDRLNPYRQDGVRIYAKMLTHLPAQNVKSLPGTSCNMMLCAAVPCRVERRGC